MALKHIASVDDLRNRAKSKLPKAVFEFIAGGADDELTLRSNSDDYRLLRLKQRVLCGAGTPTLDSILFNEKISLPLIIGPTGLANLACPNADSILAAEAARANIPFVLSTSSSSSLEDVAKSAGDNRWFQLYVFRDRSITSKLIERARREKYKALVVTVDVPVLGKRERDVRNGFTVPLKLSPSSFLDFATHPRWCLSTLIHGVPTLRNFQAGPGQGSVASLSSWINSELDPSLTWDSIKWLRDQWQGPVLLKGILAPEDAAAALGIGVDGIVISNHGGRQLDGTSSSIEALKQIKPIVGDKLSLIVDGGVRRGSDIVKALALGANAVMIGRPTLYGAAAAGSEGVRHCLTILQEEVRRTLTLIGQPNLGQLDSSCLLPDRAAISY